MREHRGLTGTKDATETPAVPPPIFMMVSPAETNGSQVRDAMRWMASTVIMLESALDELAEQMQRDLIELRRCIQPDKDPASKSEFSERSLVEAYRRAAEAFGWEQCVAPPRCWRDGE